MNRWGIATVVGSALLVSACTSGAAGTTAEDSSSASTTPASRTSSSPSASPSGAVQTAIPDGIYRTRPRTTQDLIALGLTRDEIAKTKENEQWDTSIVYELRIQGDQFVLTASSDGGPPYSADHGTFTVHGHTLVITSFAPPPAYYMRYSFSRGLLQLTLVRNTIGEAQPDCCSDFMVRAAYEALPFEAVA